MENIVTPSNIKMETEDDADEAAVRETVNQVPSTNNIEVNNKPSLTPIVYTTKLDQMNAVQKNLREYKAKDIIEMLLKESKPACGTQICNLPTKCELEDQLNSFIKLCSFVQQINFKARLQVHNTYVRNLKLWNKCKPLSIVLKDIKIQHKSGTEKITKNKTISPQFNSFLEGSSDDDDIVLKDLKRNRSTAGIPSRTPQEVKHIRSGLIVLLNKNTRHADLYRVSNDLIIEHNATTHFDESKLTKTYPPTLERVHKSYCCWFKREEIITNLCYSKTIGNFLRKPHNCDLDDCKCCCKVNSISKSTRKEVIDVQSKNRAVADDWIRGLLNRHQSANFGLISIALNYIPRGGKKETISKEPEKYLENKVLHIENKSLMFQQLKIVREYYELGNNGDIVRHMTGDKRDTLQLYIDTSKPVMYNIACCWYQREKVINKLQQAKLSPTALCFIRVSHMCPVYDCKCCCKPRNLPIKDLKWLETPRHTTYLDKNENILNIKFNGRQDYKKVCQNSAVETKETETAKEIEEISGSIIDILNKFKGVKFTVNEEGKLTAGLNTPAKNLTTSELKLLAEILTCVSKHIAEIGIAPVEFCNKINSRHKIQHDGENVVKPQATDRITATSPKQISPKAIQKPQKYPATNKMFNGKPPLDPLPNQMNNNIGSKQPFEYESKTTSTKSLLEMYKSISNLMGIKSINYVQALKSHLRNNFPTSNFKSPLMPDVKQFPPVAGVRAEVETCAEKIYPLPKIASTYTLASTSGGEIPGNGEVSASRVLNTSDTSDNTNVSRLKRTAEFIKGPVDKKIRVKPIDTLVANSKQTVSVDALVASSKQTVSSSSVVTQTDSQLITSKSQVNANLQQSNNQSTITAAQVMHPNMQLPAFIVGNQIVAAPNIVQFVSNSGQLYKVNTSPTVTSLNKNANGGVQMLAFNGQSQSNNGMLAQILSSPPIQLTQKAGTENFHPQLVPIRQLNVIPNDTKVVHGKNVTQAKKATKFVFDNITSSKTSNDPAILTKISRTGKVYETNNPKSFAFSHRRKQPTTNQVSGNTSHSENVEISPQKQVPPIDNELDNLDVEMSVHSNVILNPHVIKNNSVKEYKKPSGQISQPNLRNLLHSDESQSITIDEDDDNCIFGV